MPSTRRTLVLLALSVIPSVAGLRADEGPPREPKTVQVVVGADGETRFAPAAITVHPGDTVRFVAFAGVHNVHFPQESNTGATGLPKPSDWLLRDGDTYLLRVGLRPGTYHFQCDPHALMGMKGTLTVVD
jgi:plastocyanin